MHPERGSCALAARDAALLAWLAIEGPTPRARISALLWPQSDPVDARNVLRQRLFQLKRQLGVQLVVGSANLALSPEVTHDLADSQGLLGDLSLDSGLGVADKLTDWLRCERERRIDVARAELVNQSALDERAGNFAKALISAHSLLTLSPLSEEAHRRVIRLYYLGGDRSTALLAFDRCEQLLKDEVGTSPSVETLALLATLNSASPSSALIPAQAVPASMLRPLRLIGRADEVHALARAWAAGQVFSLYGEAGMGKSRLLQDVVQSNPGTVLAQARPGDAVVPYALVARMLRGVIALAPGVLSLPMSSDLARVLPEMSANLQAPPSSAVAQRLALQRAIAALLSHATEAGHPVTEAPQVPQVPLSNARPLRAVLLDDLHFADDASLELLMILARQGTVPDLRWGFAQRPSEGSPAVAALHEALLEEHQIAVVALQPLLLPHLQELVVSLGVDGLDASALALQLHQRTGGNPLFALETLRQVWLEGHVSTPNLPRPVSVMQLLQRRIARLSTGALRIARCAAVAGPDFSIDLASHALGQKPIDLADPWAELEAAQVFRDGAFAHDLIFEAALASLPQAIARHLHRDVAEFLQNRQVEPARLARHWQQARAWPQAGAAYLQAASHAGRLGRHREEISALDQAVLCLQQADDTSGVFQALLDKALALCQVEFGPSLHAVLQQAETLADSQPRQLALLAQKARVYDLILDPRAAATAQAGLALARTCQRMDVEVQCSLSLAYGLANERQGAQAVALLQPLLAWVHQNQSLDDRYEFEMALAFALDYAGQLAASLPHWDRARSLAEQDQAQAKLAVALSNKAATLAKMGRVLQAAELGATSLDIRRAEPGLFGMLMVAQMTHAHRLRDLGRYREALPLLQEALQCFEDARALASLRLAEHRLAHTYLFLGQPARAKALLALDADGLDVGTRVIRRVYQAELAHSMGADGSMPAREALALMANQPDDIYHRIATLFASRILPPDEGLALATSLAEWATGQNRLGLALSGHVRAAAAALKLGMQGAALVHVRAGLRLGWHCQPDSFYQAELWLVAAQVFQAAGLADEARAALVEGRTWIMRVHTQHVPPEFQSSFLQRNPVNRELLALAAAVLT